ncbi:TetR/AcrR family transcriptional regulator [Kutzneria buriramensis]|uniref:AcrR family transcriptional regulator n=1 Tax=Kutzneria buriramensis TaxID=1045776 RepID=A0A3E0I6X7_9PSEU|nr:TetR/AcrR family transcriptional regulator [Kutzneria buriramensis]REH54387.1 AcrR family transcriptional regulator [Kutzneria buriramensis]
MSIEQRRPVRRTMLLPAEAEILRRGLDAFAELGYEATSVRELGNRLGVSHNFVNDRYGSKAAFWQAVVDFALSESRRRLDPVLVQEVGDPAERLAAIVRRFYQIAIRNPQLSRLTAYEGTRDSARLDYLYDRFLHPILLICEPSVDELVAAGRMRRVPLFELYALVAGPIAILTQGPLGRRFRAEPVTERELTATADSLATMVMSGLLRD